MGKINNYARTKKKIELGATLLGTDKNGATAAFDADELKAIIDGNFLNSNGTPVVIVDNLASDSTTSVLSAKQGKKLNEDKVDKVTGKVLISAEKESKIPSDTAAEIAALTTKINTDTLKAKTDAISAAALDATTKDNALKVLIDANTAAISGIANGHLGTLEHDDPEPKPGQNGLYTFSTAGTVTWLGNQAVKIGDEVSVKFSDTDPDTYVYTYINNQYELSDSITSDSITVAASSKAVKTLNDNKTEKVTFYEIVKKDHSFINEYEGKVQTGSYVNGFYIDKITGAKVANASYRYFKYDIPEGVDGIQFTGSIEGGGIIAVISTYNSDDEFTGTYLFNDISPAQKKWDKFQFIIPTGTAYVLFCSTIYEDMWISKGVFTYDKIDKKATSNFDGKSIVWYGTSIPAGNMDDKTYPYKVASKLGATVYNEAMGSSSIRRGRDYVTPTEQDPYGWAGGFWENAAFSLASTLSEKQFLIDNITYFKSIFVNGNDMPTTQVWLNIFKDCSYEKRLVERHLGANRRDLYVLDHGCNDQNDNISTEDISKTDITSRDRDTYFGATNFIIDTILTDNPRAKIIQISYYESQTERGSAICEAQQKIANYRCIPIIRMDKILGWTQDTVKTTGYWRSNGNEWNSTYTWVESGGPEVNKKIIDFWCPDGVHPHKDEDGRGIDRYTEILVEQINYYSHNVDVNLDYSDSLSLNSSKTLATSKAIKTINDNKLEKSLRSSALNSDSEETVATSKAIKTLNDNKLEKSLRSSALDSNSEETVATSRAAKNVNDEAQRDTFTLRFPSITEFMPLQQGAYVTANTYAYTTAFGNGEIIMKLARDFNYSFNRIILTGEKEGDTFFQIVLFNGNDYIKTIVDTNGVIDYTADVVFTKFRVDIGFNELNKRVSNLKMLVDYQIGLIQSASNTSKLQPIQNTYNYDSDNLLIDRLSNGGEVIMLQTNGYNPNYSNGYRYFGSGVTVTKSKHSKFHNKFDFSGVDVVDLRNGENDTNKQIFDIYYLAGKFLDGSQLQNNSIAGLWVDRTQLNGNGIAIINVWGTKFYMSNPSNLARVGWKGYENGDPTKQVGYEVVVVDGNFSYIKFYTYSTDGEYNRLRVLVEKSPSGNANVGTISFYNPSLIYAPDHSIDPYFRYKSKAEKNSSDKIGKNCIFVGDSQTQDGIVASKLAYETGMNIFTQPSGGHAMKYRQGMSQNDGFGTETYQWFYHENLRFPVMEVAANCDYAFFHISTNDNSGGGELSKAAIDVVEANYPSYYDYINDQQAYDNKLAAFSVLSGEQKESYFGFAQTYAAYIRELMASNKDIRIVLGSVPISAGHLTGSADGNGDGIWNNTTADAVRDLDEQNRILIREDIIDIKNRFGLNFVDLWSDVGLTYDNFTKFCVDGTHWKSEIKLRIAKIFAEEFKKI